MYDANAAGIAGADNDRARDASRVAAVSGVTIATAAYVVRLLAMHLG